MPRCAHAVLLTLTLTLVTVAACGRPGAHCDVVLTSSEDTRLIELAAFVERDVNGLDHPGAAVVVIDGGEAHHVLVGRDREDPLSCAPLGPETRFRVPVNQGLPLHALALMALTERAPATLDAAVRDVLPELPLRDDIGVGVDAVKLHHLLTWSSGLRPGTYGPDLDCEPGELGDLERSLKARDDLRIVVEPGLTRAMNEQDVAIAALAAEALNGAPYADTVAELVFERFQMPDATFSEERALSGPSSPGTDSEMRWKEEPLCPESRTFFDVWLSVRDLEAAGLHLIDQPLELFTTGAVGLTGSRQRGYGFDTLVGHGPLTAIQWGHGNGAYLVVIVQPEARVAVLSIVNEEDFVAVFRLAFRALQLFGAELPPPFEDTAPIGDYVGRYERPDGKYFIDVREEEGVLKTSGNLTLIGFDTVLAPTDMLQWLYADSPWSGAGERDYFAAQLSFAGSVSRQMPLRFWRDRDGAVFAVAPPDGSMNAPLFRR